MKERLEKSINFLRSMLYQARKSGDDRIELDLETVEILLTVLKDVKASGEKQDDEPFCF